MPNIPQQDEQSIVLKFQQLPTSYYFEELFSFHLQCSSCLSQFYMEMNLPPCSACLLDKHELQGV
jgi:hypothetical protein